jgi:protein phosphatase
MTLARTAAATHAGRKRRRNEDAYVCEPPLFAVADGMGGAQAGEIASQLAAAAVRDVAGSEGGAEERVTTLIREANQRVYQRASEDEAASGMGTTMTVAYVADGEVTIGHVGDSRAYLFREDRLEQVTEDHSLVAELVRSGKLSPEEAETHPQRSVITRALGTEPDVDVDTFSVRTQPGDLFLLCSDGLTSMVDDETILRLVEKHRGDLDAAARALVQAANRGGGEDNITVVFFEIAAAGAAAEPLTDGGRVEEEDTLTEAEAMPTVAEPEVEWDEDEWPVAQAPARRRVGKRALGALVAFLVVLAIGAALALFGLSRAHFVGAEKDGHLAVYQGVPWDLVGGLRLYRTVYVSPVVAAQLTQTERRRLFDHDLTTEAAALRKVRLFEGQVVP